MRIALVATAVLLSACSKTTTVDAGVAAPPDAAGLAAAPDTKGVEGHGGIAVEAPRADLPADLDGVGEVDPNRFLMKEDPSSDPRIDAQRAKDAYLTGYRLKETQPDDACEKFKEAIILAPPGDETYDRALRQSEKYCHEIGNGSVRQAGRTPFPSRPGPDCQPYSTPDGELHFKCPDGGDNAYRRTPIDERKGRDLLRRALLVKDTSPMMATDLVRESLMYMDPRTDDYVRTEALLKLLERR